MSDLRGGMNSSERKATEAWAEAADERDRCRSALKDAVPFLDYNHFAHKMMELEGDYKLTFDAQCVRCRAERVLSLR